MKSRSTDLLIMSIFALAACGPASNPGGDDDQSFIDGGDGVIDAGGNGFIDAVPIPDANGLDAAGCATLCSLKETCSSVHEGIDDNCDGEVDEGCTCMPGQVSACFKGDPAYRSALGCFDGTMACDATGHWGACTGGAHASDNPPCYGGVSAGCHAIQSTPFATVALKPGTGNFSMGAVSETFTVTCPAGVAPCPAVMGLDSYQPLQSGEYSVHYEKTIAGGVMSTCDFPLVVGAPGLRIELEWEHNLGGTGVDLDLHLHQPGTTTPHSVGGSAMQDCGFGNCTEDSFEFPLFGSPPNWFPAGNVPPAPVNWYLDPVFEKNTCFYAPRGVGAAWQAYGMGCHNPRLDLDNITCDATIVDPNSTSFCSPENINIDFMPENVWTRVSVNYYSSHGVAYNVHPNVKIFCDGSQVAELGSAGYFVPEAPVTWTPADGAGIGTGSKWWMVADVIKYSDGCVTRCMVVPIYADAATHTPFMTTGSGAEASFGPPYPPLP